MTDIPRSDLHVHTKYLKCANETMEVSDIIRECERIGVTSLGITDHLNYVESLDLHLAIRKDIEALEPNLDIYFGAELNFTGMDEGFVLTPENKEQYGFQFAIAGIHGTYLEEYDLKQIVDIQHRHHLKVCNDPIVDVLVHPYWFPRREFSKKDWPWFDSMQAVPESYTRELGQAAKETGTAIEINAFANLASEHYSDRYKKEYMDYLSILAEEGVCFTTGSDAHNIGHLAGIEVVWKAAEQLGLSADRMWQPPCEPLIKGKRSRAE
ncbi:MAG: PHP domain-containing protein [Kiritimatiellae bacterium]|nr:PHP domain-containing protein [Kiritimatiellia bacterium]